MSLIAFHRLLIGSGIVFCHGFAVWQFVGYARDGGLSRLLVGIGFAIAGVALTVYLFHLRRVLKLPARDEAAPEHSESR